ncbi:MAG: ornithine cyclodeaminase family protein, partial [Gemmataceae bacterium]|nr:ornithine cyclodeaminase family protein [Gemmataceae bacterium]
RCQTDHAMLHVLSAAGKTLGVLGFKAYVTTRKSSRFYVHLFDGRTGELTAWIQADYLGQVRTGAASGVATKYLARSNAETLGILGSGKQARTQVQAICQVRPIRHVRVYSPNADHRRAFAEEMSALCRVEVQAVDSPEQAAKDRDIVVTATNSREPVLRGEWISPGCHLNIIGSNFLSKSEIDVETVRKADRIVVDCKDQARIEAGDLHEPLENGLIQWADVDELGHIIAGRLPGRQTDQEITLFKSLGIGIEDVATAARVVARAKELGLGTMLNVS